jgi:hypothetical protein
MRAPLTFKAEKESAKALLLTTPSRKKEFLILLRMRARFACQFKKRVSCNHIRKKRKLHP